ncbi:GmrSD restriction endonuclease domain-containing protein [Aquisalimonas asiatica]|uniref:Putative DNA-binding domain-containing protein n=1 Tax=Aquisalimonas asiatica TaxID=406100 RepID=A0A1H8UX76_9GAMM|nr:DUF262 domain-containing protein [Aquisalimonas asiatica]SEP07759.1 Putative DNA-binding domain-containing protein [Aquisalimonas asiatica]
MADLASQPTSIQSIYSWYKEDKLYVNRRYQRKLVWTQDEKQRLIESILKRYPIPALFVAEREEAGTYEIIDGLQRLHAIVSFIETSFPDLDGQFFNLEHFPTAKSRADSGGFDPTQSESLIDQGQVTTILDYTLALSVMRNATEDEINDVFDRINTYGHRLSDQERRQAGVQNEFSEVVRHIACEIRGDDSADVLTLSLMPSVSVDLPMSKHGYEVRADEVFWVQQGILRSTDLRDSEDEQCIADIVASIVGSQPIPRSKDALDSVYADGSEENRRILSSLDVYGPERISEEFKFCVEEIQKICSQGGEEKLRDLIFEKRTTNPFPSVFAVLFIALHETFVKDKKVISDYECAKKSLNNLVSRVESGRKAGSPSERRKNIATAKALLDDCLIDADGTQHIYGSQSTVDIQNALRRSEAEHSRYELKQGLLSLSDDRKRDGAVVDKVIKTICAIANNGPSCSGQIIIGVADKEADKKRISEIDGVEGKRIGRKYVVGVKREADVLGITIEQYYSQWKEAIRNSGLSGSVRDSVLSNMDYNEFYGLGVITITIPPQCEMSYVGEETFLRSGDDTLKAETAQQIASIAKRF